jgi:hypothetical protein
MYNLFRPTSWELKDILEGEQKDADSYLDAAKIICGAENVFDPIEEEAEEELYEEQLTESDVYTSISMDESSEFEVYEEPQYTYIEVSSEKQLPPVSTIPTPQSNLQFSSKV